ncbi:unnamed protein product [Phytophthora lilii]|uniref:Unnamed protein product n=1 Tax=Phytophthora lilii TaxID=2077276 RepID=A0A9W6U7L6_9STRA|nr:unnamed protein product [Phytophthora lilii]
MADADQAQHNALNAVFGGYHGFHSLMCFFHVMENIQKQIKSFPSLVAASVTRELYDLHFARNATEFAAMQDDILQRWMKYPCLSDFDQCMYSQWLFGRFSTWQAFITPSDFATTNNPAETFNAILKRDYTLRRRLKMRSLLLELVACEDRSLSPKTFQFDALPSSTLVRRVSELTREKLFGMGMDISSINTSARPR